MAGRAAARPAITFVRGDPDTMQRAYIAAPAALLVLAIAMGVGGCTRPQTSAPTDVVVQPAPPVPADLTSPAAAVAAYLDWVGYAYRLGDSDVASHTMGSQEEVRVDSYVQLNKERQRRMAQVLTSFRPRAATVDGARATVGADEVWDYRYLSADGERAISETHTTSYETTYVLVLEKPATWVIDSVVVRALGEVK